MVGIFRSYLKDLILVKCPCIKAITFSCKDPLSILWLNIFFFTLSRIQQSGKREKAKWFLLKCLTVFSFSLTEWKINAQQTICCQMTNAWFYIYVLTHCNCVCCLLIWQISQQCRLDYFEIEIENRKNFGVPQL